MNLPPGIRQHGNRFQVRYYAPNGKRQMTSFTRLTDAKRFQREVAVDKDRGQWLDPAGAQTPFDAWALTHLESRHSIGPVKRANTESVLRCHLIGGFGFGSTPIGKITPLDVQAWVNQMVGAGYAPSYVRNTYATLCGILKAAASAKLIREAPVAGIELPAAQRKRERFLSESEIDRLIECISPEYRALVLTAAWTGLRWGELAALRREHLDLDRAQLRVRSTLTRYGVKDCPKSDSGRRTIGLPASVVRALAGRDGEYVFGTAAGSLLNNANFRTRHFQPAVEAAGLSPLTFHDLRHTHVALLIRYNWQEYQIVRRMGWSDGAMLYRVYGHLFPNHDGDLVVDLEQRLQASRVSNVTALPVAQNF